MTIMTEREIHELLKSKKTKPNKQNTISVEFIQLEISKRKRRNFKNIVVIALVPTLLFISGFRYFSMMQLDIATHHYN